MKEVVGLVFVTAWVAGLVIAKGFWGMFFAIFVPPYAWYLVIELILPKVM